MDLNRILNLRSFDYEDTIYDVVLDEKNKLLEQTDNLAGFCKYIASSIDERLRQLGIRTYYIDLNSIGVDHVFLICEYRNQDMVRFLIDPTIEQFTRRNNKTLLGLKKWPSDLMYEDVLEDLLITGMVKIDSDVLNNYLSSFGSTEIITNLDDYLLNIRMNKLGKSK